MVSPDNSDGSASAASTAGQSGSPGILTAVTDIITNIEQAIQRTLAWDGTGHRPGSGDHWVSGDTNWDSFDLPTLVSMVAVPASPTQVDTVASAWRTNGAAITQSAENLTQSLSTLMSYWQGPAASQAVQSVTNSANWISTVGDTAAKMADSVEDSGGALQSAQNTMPGQPTNAFWTSFNTAADGANAGSAAGPVGAAAGAMSGGLTSVFGSGSEQTSMKQQAVQTMQRYEQAAVSIDSGTPQFSTPPSWGVVTGSTGGSGIPGLPTVSGSTLAGVGGGGLSTLPSFADSPLGRWNALTGGGPGAGGAGQLGIGGGHGADGGGFAGMFGGGGLGGVDDEERRSTTGDSQSGAAAVASAAREDPAGVVGRGAGSADSASVMEDVDGPGGAVAAPMGGGMMGGMGRGAGTGGDGEHRRRIPFEEDPFLTGLKAAPRVIGISSLDREDERK